MILIKIMVAVIIVGVLSITILTILIDLQRRQLVEEIQQLEGEWLDLTARKIAGLTIGARCVLAEEGKLTFVTAVGDTTTLFIKDDVLFLNQDSLGFFDTAYVDTLKAAKRLVLGKAGRLRIISWR